MKPVMAPEALADAAPFVLLDARAAGAWSEGHFEGAFDADVDRYLSTASDPGFDPAPRGRHPLPTPERWELQLGLWGIGPRTLVIAYDGSRGAMGACRLWWMLRAVGHENVAVLDGGVEAGRAAGLRWTSEPSAPPVSAPRYPAGDWLWPVIDADQAKDFGQDSDKLLIDVRAPARWRGEVEPLDPVPGHIPGSVNVFLEANLRPDGRFKDAEELRNLYAPILGSRPLSHVAVHCGSGVSACHTLLALELAGFSGASLYVGSYSQWSRTGRPVAKEA